MRRRRAEKLLAPLRVLMTIDAVGDVWRFSMDLARALQPRGVSFVFVAFGPNPSAGQLQEAEALGDLVHLPLPPDWLATDEGEVAGVPERLAALADDHEVDLIHLNLPTQAAGLETAKPVVVMSHSCVPTWFRAVKKTAAPDDWQWHERLNRQGISRADAVLAPSRAHADLMISTYGPIRNLRVVHYATGAVPRAADRIGRQGVVAVGRWWDEGKNGAVLHEAAARMTPRLTMIGATAGPNGERLEIRHADHTGPLSHAETVQRIGAAEVFISPSLYEPFGLAALEAAACRTPLVLADIPTYRELWEGAALFVSPTDPSAYADAVYKLLHERQLREIFAQLASNRATRFTPVRQAAAMRTVYDSLTLPTISMTAG
ncbi:MAG TPA: glycosyltransferase family 4 protein [Ensifer sp.]|nr:glycosyltransferase family 4 protein [Ensifer sp.]